jgi:hypothetical protein
METELKPGTLIAPIYMSMKRTHVTVCLSSPTEASLDWYEHTMLTYRRVGIGTFSDKTERVVWKA